MSGSTFAPGVREALEAQMGSDAPTVAVIKVDAPRFIGGAARSTVMPLSYPLEYDGVEYRAVTLKRMRASEVAAFVEAMTTMSPEDRSKATFPVYFTEDGATEIPTIVLDAMDDDDREAISKAAESFLPRRFQAAMADDTPLSSGASTGP